MLIVLLDVALEKMYLDLPLRDLDFHLPTADEVALKYSDAKGASSAAASDIEFCASDPWRSIALESWESLW